MQYTCSLAFQGKEAAYKRDDILPAHGLAVVLIWEGRAGPVDASDVTGL